MHITIVHPCRDAAAAFVSLMDSSLGREGISSLFQQVTGKNKLQILELACQGANYHFSLPESLEKKSKEEETWQKMTEKWQEKTTEQGKKEKWIQCWKYKQSQNKIRIAS